MPVYNWNQLIQGLPADWRQTGGAGVKIALLDSGADLTHPDLTHLDLAGHKFNTGQAGIFSEDDPMLGNDDVSDSFPFDHPHGTTCLSILAARTGAADGVAGMAPEAEIFVVKVGSDDGQAWQDSFLRGLHVARRLDVDIIVAPVLPTLMDTIPDMEIQEVFEAIALQHILLVTPLYNSDDWADLTGLQFPSDRPESITAGVIRDGLLASLPASTTLPPGVHAMMPECEVRVCGAPDGDYMQLDNTCSLATACLGGLLALCLAVWKQAEGSGYRRRTKAEALAALLSAALPFSIASMRQHKNKLQFFHRPTSHS